MILDKKDQDQKKKHKPLCQICHQNPATTTMPGPLGLVDCPVIDSSAIFLDKIKIRTIIRII